MIAILVNCGQGLWVRQGASLGTRASHRRTSSVEAAANSVISTFYSMLGGIQRNPYERDTNASTSTSESREGSLAPSNVDFNPVSSDFAKVDKSSGTAHSQHDSQIPTDTTQNSSASPGSPTRYSSYEDFRSEAYKKAKLPKQEGTYDERERKMSPKVE